MKRHTLKVLTAFIFFICTQTIHSQQTVDFNNNFRDHEISQINEFIKNAFPKSHKYKEIKRFFNKKSKGKKEVEKEVEMNYKASLTNFKGCSISFSNSLKSSEMDYSEKVNFSLKDIDPAQISIVSQKDEISLSFYSNTNSIVSKRYSYDNIISGGDKTYRESEGRGNFYTITLQSVVNSVDIENAVKKAVTLCQSKI